MADAQVYLGSWTNWKNGRIAGLTLTTTNTVAGFLVILTALFVGQVGRSVRKLMMYAIYQFRATSKIQDVLYHQQQATLRNTSSPAANLVKQLELSWHWKSKARHGCMRPLQFAVIALLHILVWTTTGLLSSKISPGTAEVLITSHQCGYHQPSPDGSIWTGFSTPTYDFTYAEYLSSLLWLAFTTVKSCNTAWLGASILHSCDPNVAHLTQKQTVKSFPDSCPFNESSCVSLSEDTWLDFNYGHSPIAGRTYEEGTMWESNVKANPQATFRLRSTAYFRPLQPYSISVRTAFVGQSQPNSYFNPIPDLNRSEADVSLIFLQNQMRYANPINDSWFSATTTDPMHHAYKSDKQGNIGVLGCAEQYEFCNPINSKCIGPMGLDQIDVSSVAQEIGLNSRQATLVSHLGRLFLLFTLSNVWGIVPPTSLLATSSSAYDWGTSSSLPPGQWQLEVAHWISSMRVALQQALIDYATGPRLTSEGAEPVLDVPSPGTPQHDLCSSQLRPDSAYRSLSILGLFLTYTIGGVIILLGISRPILHKFRMRSRRKRNPNWQDSWLFDDYIHWQQRALEGAQIGTWTKLKNSVPVTSTRVLFRPIWYGGAQREQDSDNSSRANMQPTPVSSSTGHV